MSEMEHQKYVVLEFGAVDGYYDKVQECGIIKKELVEVAAVKIENNKISGYFHSYIAIDGCDADDIALGAEGQSAYYIQSAHLIGASSFEDVAKQLFEYVGSAPLIIRKSFYTEDLFPMFSEKAAEFGYSFDNLTIDVDKIVTADRLKSSAIERHIKLDCADCLTIAQLLSVEQQNWPSVFKKYGILFDVGSKEQRSNGRNDPLGWALAIARMAVAIITSHNETIYTSDIFLI